MMWFRFHNGFIVNTTLEYDDTLTLFGVTSADAGSYTCALNTDTASVQSPEATLYVQGTNTQTIECTRFEHPDNSMYKVCIFVELCT